MNLKKILFASLMTLTLANLTACQSGPKFPHGVVEGFYGRPYGTMGRLSLLDFMGGMGLNLYVYGPKDDPYHTEKWAEPYPEKEARELKEVLACAEKNGVQFYWAIHLGSALRDLNDYAACHDKIFAKMQAMYDLGFRNLAVFFDDFGPVDAKLHSKVCNDMAAWLREKGGMGPLIACPNIYSGDGASDYCKEMGENVDQSVQLIWTGQGVCCDPLPEVAERTKENYRRAPFLWWNWPVNDYCRSHLIMGRLYGLPDYPFAGIMLNPMENCEASKVALYSFAKWCQDPNSFDSQKVWQEGFREMYPAKIADAMEIFCRHNSDMGDTWCGYHKQEGEGAKDFKQEFKDYLSAIETLQQELPGYNERLYWELRGWLEVGECQAKMGLELEDYRNATPERRQKILSNVASLEAERQRRGEAARQRFAAATFAGDKDRCQAPVTAGALLEPRIQFLLQKAKEN